MTDLDFAPELREAAEQFHWEIVRAVDSTVPPPKNKHRKQKFDGTLSSAIEIVPFSDVYLFGFDIGVFDPDLVDYAERTHEGSRFEAPNPFISRTVDENEEKIVGDLKNAIARKVEAIFD